MTHGAQYTPDGPIVAAVAAHAAQAAPRECCGVVVLTDGLARYRACRNASQGDSEFEIMAEDWAAAEDAGAIVAVCHSHPFTSPEPSQADLVACERSGLPWLIVNHPVGHWRLIEPSGYRAPLIGRQFSHGVLDCYTLLRDYFLTVGVVLQDFERSERWWEHGGDLYRQHFAEAGFEAVKDGPREHDVLLMTIASRVPNHAAVYVGQQLILHHLQDRMSCRTVYGGWYRKNTTNILRHRDLK